MPNSTVAGPAEPAHGPREHLVEPIVIAGSGQGAGIQRQRERRPGGSAQPRSAGGSAALSQNAGCRRPNRHCRRTSACRRPASSPRRPSTTAMTWAAIVWAMVRLRSADRCIIPMKRSASSIARLQDDATERNSYAGSSRSRSTAPPDRPMLHSGDTRSRSMRHFPIFMDLQGRRALVLGNGEAAARKAAALRRCGAEVTQASAFDPALLDGCAIAIGAEAPEADLTALCKQPKRAASPSMWLDRPALCSFLTPAFVDRDPITIAVSSGGRRSRLGAADPGADRGNDPAGLRAAGGPGGRGQSRDPPPLSGHGAAPPGAGARPRRTRWRTWPWPATRPPRGRNWPGKSRTGRSRAVSSTWWGAGPRRGGPADPARAPAARRGGRDRA